MIVEDICLAESVSVFGSFIGGLLSIVADWVVDGFKVSGSDLSGLLVYDQAVLRIDFDVELLFEHSALDSGGVLFEPVRDPVAIVDGSLGFDAELGGLAIREGL